MRKVITYPKILIGSERKGLRVGEGEGRGGGRRGRGEEREGRGKRREGRIRGRGGQEGRGEGVCLTQLQRIIS